MPSSASPSPVFAMFATPSTFLPSARPPGSSSIVTRSI